LLGKLETIARSGQGDDFAALVGGVEYTFYGIRGSNTDLGLLAEYLYDDRDQTAPLTALDDDIFVGARFTLNDPDDTNILAGAIVDPEDGETVALIEAQRRFGERWKLEAELRLLTNISDKGRLFGIERDSYLTLCAAWYF